MTLSPALRDLAARWDSFALDRAAELATPALLVDAAAVEQNVAAVVAWLGDPLRWRPHVKTAKLGWTVQRLLDHGVRRFKCATTVELALLVQAGAPDALFAICARGANAGVVRDLAAGAGSTTVSVLVEGPDDLAEWTGARVGVFIDVDTGYRRSGIPVVEIDRIVALAGAVADRGLRFDGVHAYEGWPGAAGESERRRIVDSGLTGLARLARALERAGAPAPEVVTSGSRTTSWAVEHGPLRDAAALHSVSPGTVVYHDVRTELTSPWRPGLRPAVAVLTRVVSSARPGQVTCDAGHKSVAADAGDPVGLVAGRPDLGPLSPSEEHLPLAVDPSAKSPRRGDMLTLVPMHVCPTVNLHDVAVLVRDGVVDDVVPVSGRGHQDPTQRTPARSPADPRRASSGP